MMQAFEKYGILLRRMAEGDLDLVREQRNRPEVMCHMTTQHVITPEEMLNWFRTLPDNYYYWMVEWRGQIVGQVSMKVDDAGVGTSGIILWNNDFQEECGALRASMANFYHFYEVLGGRRMCGLVAMSNKRALRLFKAMEGNLDGERRKLDGKEYLVSDCDTEWYYKVLRKWRNVLSSFEKETV